MNLNDLTEIERKTYEFIKEAGEIQPKNMPDSRMVGAIANARAWRAFHVHFLRCEKSNIRSLIKD